MNRIALLFGVFALATACKSGKDLATASKVNTTITTIKQAYAPDKRVAVFKVEPIRNQGTVLLRGETNLPEAKDKLLAQLRTDNVPYIDSIQVLPAQALGAQTYGVVSVSVANIRSQPAHSAELATQATLGTPVKVLNKNGSWYQVQTPDNYISWVDEGGIKLMNKQEFDTWQQAKKIIYLNMYGLSYSEPNTDTQTVSDLVSGDVLWLKGERADFYQVAYPDGREAYIPKASAQVYESWVASLNPTEESLISTAKKLMGIPYLWGGTSLKGMDCSGFTKNVYFLNGLVLPRDASQQVHTGNLIDTSNGFEDLRPGDLVFFGKPAANGGTEKVTHVGMWIGNYEYIHASGSSGKVTVNSFDKQAKNFNRSIFDSFLRAKRILNSTQGDILKLQSAKVY
ncbi:C40 family peptidase [Rhodocytophaga aerolata]|uniref:C40 family peptidase n=1 Tax=Rhodocytophaga aerolata TaxID=455078 RepID=A0ABT8R5P1_9BACT|nr:C40 family peptidase [Rhodocytophaga aerolata]MDO1445990.1 C40 family peptidase [Rhodocytophaga aerolata]